MPALALRWRPARPRGFSFIELMLSLALLAVLASVAVPMLQRVQLRQRELELSSALREIRQAIDAYKRAAEQGQVALRAGDSGFPPSLEALEEGVPDERTAGRQKLYFLRRVPRDPFATDPSQPAAQTWGKRSQQSPPDDPREGADVFDVHSRAPGVGLNGIAYRLW